MAAKSATGLKKETSAALSYVLGPVTGIVFLLLEKDSFVKFHAMQSTVTFVLLFVLQWVFAMTIILLALVPLVSILGFVLWLLLIYKAWQGQEYELPFVGKIAEQLVAKM